MLTLKYILKVGKMLAQADVRSPRSPAPNPVCKEYQALYDKYSKADAGNAVFDINKDRSDFEKLLEQAHNDADLRKLGESSTRNEIRFLGEPQPTKGQVLAIDGKGLYFYKFTYGVEPQEFRDVIQLFKQPPWSTFYPEYITATSLRYGLLSFVRDAPWNPK